MAVAQALEEAELPAITGKVKWFDATRGFGFVVSDDIEGDVLIHFSVLREHGRRSVPEGATITCIPVRLERGLQAKRVIEIDMTSALPQAPRSSIPVSERADRKALVDAAGEFEPVEVKWFNRVRGYGFLMRAPELGGEDVFVHMETVREFEIGRTGAGPAAGSADCAERQGHDRGRAAALRRLAGLRLSGLGIAAILAACSPPSPAAPTNSSGASLAEQGGQTGLDVVPLTITSPAAQSIASRSRSRARPKQQEIGMMFRRSVAPDRGMLFPYSPPQPVSFWMKNTLIPLDIIFIRADRTVARIEENAVPHSLEPIPSYEPIIAILEIGGGRAAELGIKPGDRSPGDELRRISFACVQMRFAAKAAPSWDGWPTHLPGGTEPAGAPRFSRGATAAKWAATPRQRLFPAQEGSGAPLGDLSGRQ